MIAVPEDEESAADLSRTQEVLALAALSLAAFVLNLNTNVLGALLPFVGPQLGLAEHDGEWLVAAGAFGTAAGALAVAFAARRFGRRGTTQLGLVLFVASSCAHAAVGSFWPLVALRFASGAAAGLSYSAASAIAAQVVPYARRGAAMGWFTAGMFLAIPVGMPLSVWCAKLGVWQATFVTQGALAAVAVLCVSRVVPRLAGEVDRPQWKALLVDRQVTSGILATMLQVGSFFATVQLASPWLHETGLVAKEDQMWIWIALGLLSVGGSAVFGRFADRVGKRAFVLATAMVLAACFAGLALQPPPAGMLALAAVLAIAMAARTGPLQALLSGLTPPALLGSLMGLRSASMHVGSGTFALIAQPVAWGFGFRGVLVFAAGCQLLSYGAVRYGILAR